LSRDDDLDGDSNSIVNQKAALFKYATEQGFPNPRFFIDDGFTGANFNRPGFQDMLSEIESGNVTACIVKDMSRFGRNYLQVGMFTEMTFPQNGVRFIAVNDNVDSGVASSDNDFTPIKNLFNEWYCRDTSKKVRAVFKAKALSGKPGNKIPYGYKKDPDDKYKWIIYEPSAEVVREMFRLCISGYGPSHIAKELSIRKLTKPEDYRRMWKLHTDSDCDWHTTVVARMLDNAEYAGTLITQRVTTQSYKSKKVIERPEDEWCVTYNHHEPIVDPDDFERVQKLRSGRRRRDNMGEFASPLSGMVYCGECGGKHFVKRARDREYEYFYCSVYYNGYKKLNPPIKCSAHSIRREALEALVLKDLKEVTMLAREHRHEFILRVQEAAKTISERGMKSKLNELSKTEARISALDTIISHIYEDNVTGKISDERFAVMLDGYEAEQAALKTKAEVISREVNGVREKAANVEKFLRAVDRYAAVTELTAEAVRTFIDRIVIHETRIEGQAVKAQNVEILYNHIGSFQR
jgi:DNA invertase Pin-like site-specific DNA recombinase